MKFGHLRFTFTIYCGLVAVSIALIYYVGRIGFTGYDAAPLARATLLSLFLISWPQVPRLLRVGARERWFLSDASWSLSGLLLVAMAGFLLSDFRSILAPLLCGLGGVLFLGVLIQWFRQDSDARLWKSILGLTSGAMLTGLSCFYPLFHEPWFREMIVAGLAHRDTMNHAALTSMIKTYGIPSTGLDGIPYHPYHNGADWLLAQISSLLGLPIIETVTMAFLVVFVPFFLSSFMCFVADVREKYQVDSDDEASSTGFLFWVVFLLMFVGVVPGHNNYMGSQSYPLALGLSFIFLSLSLHASDCIENGEKKPAWRDTVLFVVVLPLLVGLIGMCKISLAWLFMWACTYFVIRLRLYRRAVFLAAWLIMALGCLLTLRLAIYPVDAQTGISLLYSMNWYPHWWPLFFLTEFVWSWVFIGLALYMRRISSFPVLSGAIRSKRLLDVEAVAVFCVAGAVPVVMLRISDASGLYFIDFQNWLSVALLLAHLPSFLGQDRPVPVETGSPSDSHVRTARPRLVLHVVAVVIMAAVAANGLSSAFRTLVIGQVRTLVALRSDNETALAYTRSLANLSIGRFVREVFGWRDYAFAAGDQAKWSEANRRNRQTLKVLDELSGMPNAEKRRTLLYIPKANRWYWELPATRCLAVPFIAPAVTGLAMIHGLPEPDCHAGGGRYGYEVYSAASKQDSNKAGRTDDSLCLQALEKGFDKVVAFEIDRGKPEIRCLDCHGGAKRP